MLQETQDDEVIIERVAAVDVGKAELVAACGCLMRAGRAGGCRRWGRIRR